MRSRVVVLTLAALCAAPGIPLAQARRPARGAARTAGPRDTLTLPEIREALQSGDRARVLQAIRAASVLSTPEVVPPLVELLRRGPTDEMTDLVVEQLGIIGQPNAIEELSQLLHHRRAAVRRGAVAALAEIRDDRVRPLLESALHDSDNSVRGQAAMALGSIGARQSVPLLFRAFERGVPEAAESIGRLAEAAAAVSSDAAWDRDDPAATTHPRTLSMWIGRAPLSVLLRGFKAFLERRDVPVPARVRIITNLENRAPSILLRTFLQEWVAQLPAAYRGADRDAANTAIDHIAVPSGTGGH